jgi:hypothetical protein
MVNTQWSFHTNNSPDTVRILLVTLINIHSELHLLYTAFNKMLNELYVQKCYI